MASYLGMPANSPSQEILFRWTSKAQAWCKENGLELSMKPLTADALNAVLQYPELTSTIKASRCRNLLAYTTFYVIELAPQIELESCYNAPYGQESMYLFEVRRARMMPGKAAPRRDSRRASSLGPREGLHVVGVGFFIVCLWAGLQASPV